MSSTPVWIEAVSKLTPEIHEALSRLLPQLNPKLAVPDRVRLDRLVEDPDVVLLVARDGGRIVGTTTVIVYTTPFWIKARLDEVVVDEAARGKGVGEALVKARSRASPLRAARVRGPRLGRVQDRAGIVLPTH